MRLQHRQLIASVAALFAFFPLCLNAAPSEELDPAKLPPPAGRTVDYVQDIQPILERACFRCHGPNRPKSSYRVDNREDALKGGDVGQDIVLGHSETSPLIYYVAKLVPDMEMPPEGKGDPLTAEEIGLLRAWIDQGFVYTSKAPPPKESFQITPSIGYLFVDGDLGSFREHTWQRQDAQGGIEYFQLNERFDDLSRLQVDGRALRDDYAVHLDWRRDQLGFMRAGFERWSRYYDDSGGFYPGAPELEAGRDLHLDFTKVWVEAGLERPNIPRVVVGYELEQRDGAKSLTSWGPFTVAPGQIVRIAPSTKDIDETTHILRLDASHELGGVHVEDNFRYEFYRLNTEETSYTPFVATAFPESFVDNRQESDNQRLANTLRAEKQIKEWLFLSGGYLFTRSDGEASVDLNTPQVVGPFPGVFWSAQGLVLHQWAHVMNVNARLGPWQGLTFTAGLQSEWSHQEGAGDVQLDEGDLALPPLISVPATLDANQSTFQVEEHVGLRYTQIPYTVLFAEARLRQQTISQYEEQVGGLAEFLRDTDVDRNRGDLRTGFQVSPWTRVSFSGQYRRGYSRSDYDHRRDERPIGSPGFGYSAFILAQDLTSDELEGRIVARPWNWLKTTFTYRWLGSDFDTETQADPGHDLHAGNTDMHILSAGAALTPWRKVSLSGAFSYTQSRTVTQASSSPSVVPFKGDVYSVLGHVAYTLNAKTLLSGTYSYSIGDYSQDNFAEGLPLGLEYDQHGLIAGIKRTLSEKVTVALRYAFYHYREPSTDGQNDYDAHGIFATLAMRWPGE